MFLVDVEKTIGEFPFCNSNEPHKMNVQLFYTSVYLTQMFSVFFFCEERSDFLPRAVV